MRGQLRAWIKPSLLFAACVLLSWYVMQTAGSPSLPPISNGEATSGEPELSLERNTDSETPPFSSFKAIIERPLFSPSRRPAIKHNANAPRPVAELNIRLHGVIVSDNVRMAILSRPDASSVIRVREGETYQGWELVAVRPTHAIFRHDGSIIRLTIDHKRETTTRKSRSSEQ